MLLAIDTATNLAGIAIADGPSICGAYQWQTGRNHTVELMPNIMRLLGEAGAEAGQLEAVAVAIGPGSYTGLRIGLSVAKGFCLAHGAALVAVPTLDISAMGSPVGAGLLCAILQAGRGRLAAGFYRAASGQWQRAGELFFGRAPELAEACAGLESQTGSAGLQPRSESLAVTEAERPMGPAVGLEPAGQAIYFAGELDEVTIAVLRERLGAPATFAPEGERARDPRVLARLGWERLRAGVRDNLETLSPAYGQ